MAQTWHDFYIVAGGASATLVGLLFVSLSLHLRTVLARPEVRGLARTTLANFGLVLLVALIVVIPQDDAHSVGLELQATGVFSAIIIAAPVITASRSQTRTISPLLLVMRFAFSGLSYAGTVAAGVLLSSGSYSTAFACIAAATIALLVISLRNSWDLLVSVGEATLASQPRQP